MCRSEKGLRFLQNQEAMVVFEKLAVTLTGSLCKSNFITQGKELCTRYSKIAEEAYGVDRDVFIRILQLYFVYLQV